MKRILLALFVFCLSFSAFGQGKDYLLLYKPGKKSKYHFYFGQDIIIKPIRNFPTVRGTITRFSDSAIYFGPSDSVHFRDIASIVVNENPRIFAKNLWLTNLVVSTGTIGLWELMYLVNDGRLSPDVKAAPGIIAFVSVTPVLVNGVSMLVTRQECRMEDGWVLGTVLMPKP